MKQIILTENLTKIFDIPYKSRRIPPEVFPVFDRYFLGALAIRIPSEFQWPWMSRDMLTPPFFTSSTPMKSPRKSLRHPYKLSRSGRSRHILLTWLLVAGNSNHEWRCIFISPVWTFWMDFTAILMWKLNMVHLQSSPTLERKMIWTKPPWLIFQPLIFRRVSFFGSHLSFVIPFGPFPVTNATSPPLAQASRPSWRSSRRKASQRASV